MTKKEWEFVENLLERTSREMYLRGYDHGKRNVPSEINTLRLTNANKLTLRSALERHVQNA